MINYRVFNVKNYTLVNEIRKISGNCTEPIRNLICDTNSLCISILNTRGKVIKAIRTTNSPACNLHSNKMLINHSIIISVNSPSCNLRSNAILINHAVIILVRGAIGNDNSYINPKIITEFLFPNSHRWWRPTLGLHNFI